MKKILFLLCFLSANSFAFLSSPISSGGGGASPGGDPESIQINNGDGTFGGFGSWDGTVFTNPGNLFVTGTIATNNLFDYTEQALAINVLGRKLIDTDGTTIAIDWSTINTVAIPSSNFSVFGMSSFDNDLTTTDGNGNWLFEGGGTATFGGNIEISPGSLNMSDQTLFNANIIDFISGASLGDESGSAMSLIASVLDFGSITPIANAVSISATNWKLNADGSAAFANNVDTIDSAGNANFNSVNTGSYQLEGTTLVESLSMNVFTFLPNAANTFVMDGNAGSFTMLGDLDLPNFSNINGVYQILFTDGSAQLSGGAGAMIVNSSFSDSANAWGLRTDGSASFAGGLATIDSSGNVGANSFTAGNFFVSGGASFANNDGGIAFLDDLGATYWSYNDSNQMGFFGATPVSQQSGDIGTALVSYGLFSSVIVNPSVTMTSNTTATATFNSAGNDETIYDTSSTLLTALTIALPSTTRVGQILRYLSNRTVTTTTVTGTVLVGASPVLSANTSIAYQAVNTSGSFIRIQ